MSSLSLSRRLCAFGLVIAYFFLFRFEPLRLLGRVLLLLRLELRDLRLGRALSRRCLA